MALLCWAHCVVLWIVDDRVGFLSVYAPISTNGGTDFWSGLVNVLPYVDHWCVGGDFNMLKKCAG